MGPLVGKRFGFLGAGVIAEVFIRRLLDGGPARPQDILVFDTDGPILERLKYGLGILAAGSSRDVAAGCDFFFLAVPPLAVVPALKEVAPVLQPAQMVLSLAASVPTGLIEESIGAPIPVVRVIPNTPSWIGLGMNPFCLGNHVGAAERGVAKTLLAVFGRAVEIPEERMPIATALTAVGPTYIFPVIAALADAAIAHGMPPGVALSAACRVVAGAASLVENTGRSPEGLTLMVGTRTLDEAATRRLFTQAVEDAHAEMLAAESEMAAAAAPGG